MSELLTVAEAAAKLRKNRMFVLKELGDGTLRGSKFGAQWHIRPADLDAYIDSHSNDIADGAA